MAWELLAAEFAKGAGQGALGGGPTQATGVSNPFSDFSGWNVNFGAGSIDATRSQEQKGSFDQYLPYLMAVAGVLIVWRLSKR
jgi:hypothetical protein